ncbi:hypothetical protein TIFTF001_056181, partial [Ficus carica]
TWPSSGTHGVIHAPSRRDDVSKVCENAGKVGPECDDAKRLPLLFNQNLPRLLSHAFTAIRD